MTALNTTRCPVLLAAWPRWPSPWPPAADGFTRQFPIAACDFKPHGGNAFFKLKPDRQLYLSNVRCVGEGECDELEELWITMLPETRAITFEYRQARRVTVRTRVMQEYETADGEVEEISCNFVADCDPMNDVYYFGEDVVGRRRQSAARCLARGRRWRAPRHPDAGSRLPARLAVLPGNRAERAGSRASTRRMGFEVEVPAGVFRNCVEVTETTPLEPGEESLKTYCPNVGLVRDEDLELIAVYENAEPPVGERLS